MLLRKNTKAFKSIHHLVKECQHREDRQKLIRIYITKAGQSIQERISVDALQGDAALFYDLGYETLLNNLESPGHQLHSSDDVPGIYFFHSNLSKTWDETPFEFDEKIKKEFAALSDLPEVRKKDKVEKYILPAPKTGNAPEKKKSAAQPPAEKSKTKTTAAPVQKDTENKIRQPDFKLKQKIIFTNLSSVIFPKANITKEDVLQYYSKVADVILPYLRERPLLVRTSADSLRALRTLTPPEEKPDWAKTASVTVDNQKQELMLCPDKEHLLFAIQQGSVEFNPWAARVKSSDAPDYILMGIDSPKFDIAHAVTVALAAKEILDGLQLPCFIKTDGKSGLHLYLPSDGKSNYAVCLPVAEYLCKLIRLKIPNLVALEGSDDLTYGKVALSYSGNVKGKAVAAPYSLVSGETAQVATPLAWDEVNETLDPHAFTIETIPARLKKMDDPFEHLYRKKINAAMLLEKLEQNYSFLF